MKVRLVSVSAALVGCIGSSSVPCGDGTLCPAGTSCALITYETSADQPGGTTLPVAASQPVCASPAQLAACAGAADQHLCTLVAASDGRCYQGVCMPTRCGDGRIDRVDPADPTDRLGEACDDGNQADGDGCSGTCRSDETCGNGVIDPVTGEQCDDGNLASHDGCDSRCQAERPVWSPIVFGDPPAMYGAAMAYDAARDQLVLFGGIDAATGLALDTTWLHDGTRGWRQVTPELSPSPRAFHAMAYDSDRHRVVLFGGKAGGMDDETWEWDGTRWSFIATPASPGARGYAAMAYDPRRKRVVIYGGLKYAASRGNLWGDWNDTWAYDGTTWTLVTTGGPTPGATTAPPPAGTGRSKAAMTYDAGRGVLVLFGGTSTHFIPMSAPDEALATEPAWQLDASNTWSVIPTAGGTVPPTRALAAAAFDVSTGRVMVIGGNTIGALLGDAWEWTGTSWQPLTVPSAFTPRDALCAAADPVLDAVMIVGGAQQDPTVTNWDRSLWRSAATTWTSLPPAQALVDASYRAVRDSRRGVDVVVDGHTNTYEVARAGMAVKPRATVDALVTYDIAYDEARGTTVFFGTGIANDPHFALWDGQTWSEPAVALPSAFDSAAMAYDAARARVVLYGHNVVSGSDAAELWTWDGATWTQQVSAHAPPARQAGTLAYDAIRAVVVLFGGQDTTTPLRSDTWTWDGLDWTEVTTAVAPTPRALAPLAWEPHRHRLLLFGGAGATQLSDTWELDGATWTWRPVDAVPPQLIPTGALVASPDGESLVEIGGSTASWTITWRSTGVDETCANELDLDGDHLAGCADPDCAYACLPACGDGTCIAGLETCGLCPQDCGACPVVCGDAVCDATESPASCPGDCP